MIVCVHFIVLAVFLHRPRRINFIFSLYFLFHIKLVTRSSVRQCGGSVSLVVWWLESLALIRRLYVVTDHLQTFRAAAEMTPKLRRNRKPKLKSNLRNLLPSPTRAAKMRMTTTRILQMVNREEMTEEVAARHRIWKREQERLLRHEDPQKSSTT